MAASDVFEEDNGVYSIAATPHRPVPALRQPFYSGFL